MAILLRYCATEFQESSTIEHNQTDYRRLKYFPVAQDLIYGASAELTNNIVDRARLVLNDILAAKLTHADELEVYIWVTDAGCEMQSYLKFDMYFKLPKNCCDISKEIIDNIKNSIYIVNPNAINIIKMDNSIKLTIYFL